MNDQTHKTLVLTRSDMQQIVQHCGLHTIMDDLIERLISVISEFDAKQTIIPIRAGFNYTKPNTGLIEWMPMYKKGDQVVIKLVGYHPNNPDKYALPTIVSTISAYDTTTGRLCGIMDGVLLTALRTGAASAVASKYLAHPDSSTLGLIGCGAQAVTQLHAISRTFDINRVLIYDINPETMRSFEKRCAILNLDLDIIPSGLDIVVVESDILCTATSIDPGSGPLFADLRTKPHFHVNAVGSDFPGKIELPVDLLKSSFVCPDFEEQAIIEGECQQLEIKDIGPDLVEVVQNAASFAPVQQEKTVFDSTGWVLEDYVVMDLFMEHALALGLGREMEIEIMAGDAKNPYDFVKDLSPELIAEISG